MNLENNEFNEIKKTYKNLYLKSKNIVSSPNQREAILNQVVKDIFIERFNRAKNEGTNISEKEKEEILSQLKELIKDWNDEFQRDGNLNKKTWGKFWKK